MGTNTGFLFGRYYYTDFLGEKVLGVPVVVPLVWFVISYLTFSVGYNSLGYHNNVKALFGVCLLTAFGSMSWDLLVDPMFTSYGYWVWDKESNGFMLSGIPISNFVGWFVVVFAVTAVFMFITKRTTSPNALIRRSNTLDSRLAYVFLMIDGTIANLALGHDTVVVVGDAATLAFLGLSFFLQAKETARTDERLKNIEK